MKYGLEDIVCTGLDIQGQERLRVENYESIIEYTDVKIRLQAKGYRIQIEGKELMIEYFSEDEMKVSGKIEKIMFL